MKVVSLLLLTVLISLSLIHSGETACMFLRDENVVLPASLKPVRMGDFAIYTSQPELVAKQQKSIDRSARFLQIELGWKFPFTRKDLGRPVLDVYFAPASEDFTGTVRSGPVVVLNEKVLLSPDFPAIWMHFLAHASQRMYRTDPDGREDYWFYEATAAWMEVQYGEASAKTRMARHIRPFRPQMPLDDASQDSALGASLLLDQISRPYRDTIRQVWDQWAYPREERVMRVIDRVLQLNHLPPLKGYVLNYFLRAPSGDFLLNSTTKIVLYPYSAAIFQSRPGEGAGGGGVQLVFQSKKDAPGPDAASLVYHGAGDKEAIVALQESLRGPWSVSIPYAGMGGYKVVFVNASPHTVEGTLSARFDSTIPAVLQYFRATADEEGGVLLEWKTARENGVAFWNLYRIQNGTKERLNALPLPASVDSPGGLHYLFVDYVTGGLYSLEALTAEGIPSPVATTTTQSTRKQPPDLIH